jgi:hypothetical protein
LILLAFDIGSGKRMKQVIVGGAFTIEADGIKRGSKGVRENRAGDTLGLIFDRDNEL